MKQRSPEERLDAIFCILEHVEEKALAASQTCRSTITADQYVAIHTLARDDRGEFQNQLIERVLRDIREAQ